MRLNLTFVYFYILGGLYCVHMSLLLFYYYFTLFASLFLTFYCIFLISLQF